MKKLLMGSMVLLIISLSITLSQIACQKTNANPTGNTPATYKQTSLIMLNQSVMTGPVELYAVDSNGVKTKIILPNFVTKSTNYEFDSKITSDGLKIIFFYCPNGSGTPSKIYSINLDGTGLKTLLSSASDDVSIQDVI